jgi:putative tricarboxylic transport membrane protein
MRRADYIIGLILIALGIFIYFSSYSIPVMAIVEKTGMVNSRFFPKLCAISLIVFSVIMILENYIVTHNQKEKLKGQDERKETIGSIRLFVAAALTFMYLVTYQYLGHLVSSFIFIFIFMYFLSTRNLFLLISVPAAISFLIYAVFKILLVVPLPTGIIF